MDKALYVEATAIGYYGGKRVAGSKFWLANGETEFSSKWMKKANPLQAPNSTHTAQAPKRAGRMRAKGGNKEKA